MLNIIISKIERLRVDITEGKEGLEREIKKEINRLTQRIKVIKDRRERKEEDLSRKIKEALQEIKEKEKEKRKEE